MNNDQLNNDLYSDVSEDELSIMTNKGCRIVSYADLATMKKPADLFKGKLGCIMLYEHIKDEGHWVLWLNDLKNNRVKYMDSLGFKLESILDFWHIKHPDYIKPLMSNIEIDMFPVALQDYNTSTCGRHCVSRYLHRHLSDSQYLDLIKHSNVSPDIYVTLFTEKLKK